MIIIFSKKKLLFHAEFLTTEIPRARGSEIPKSGRYRLIPLTHGILEPAVVRVVLQSEVFSFGGQNPNFIQ